MNCLETFRLRSHMRVNPKACALLLDHPPSRQPMYNCNIDNVYACYRSLYMLSRIIANENKWGSCAALRTIAGTESTAAVRGRGLSSRENGCRGAFDGPAGGEPNPETRKAGQRPFRVCAGLLGSAWIHVCRSVSNHRAFRPSRQGTLAPGLQVKRFLSVKNPT